jgi:hypothetical protein
MSSKALAKPELRYIRGSKSQLRDRPILSPRDEELAVEFCAQQSILQEQSLYRVGQPN